MMDSGHPMKHEIENEKVKDLLAFIYGAEAAPAILTRLEKMLAHYAGRIPPAASAHYFDESDAVLITYGDMVQRPGEAPLRTLGGFLENHLSGVVKGVHLLPFYPYTSDDGFSVVDYAIVDPALGDWSYVTAIGRSFRLMFDAVINHISAESGWFKAFLAGDPHYRRFFHAIDPGEDLSAVFRPRALPLLTEVQTVSGPRHVWTTFSDDQIDLNFAEPEVFLAIVDLLLFYVQQGAGLIRLDAIGFMWKEIGTTCIHLPQTHALIQLFRAIMDEIAPQVVLVTETNVPHLDNISYFGDGTNEAQMVYNFSLPPLTLHAFHTGNAGILSEWARTLTLPSDRVTFFNFLASHDGIGLTPARGLLPEAAVEAIAERVLRLGGRVSYRNNPDGSQSPYELNINYFDALADPDRPDEDPGRMASRFLCAQAIMLALRGMPGIYFHSLFGSRGWPEGVAETGRARTINREKLAINRLEAELADSTSLRHRIFAGFRRLLRARTGSPAFHPTGEQEILQLHPAVFAVWRQDIARREEVICLQNVSEAAAVIPLPAGRYEDLLTGQGHGSDAPLRLDPHQVSWLRRVD